MPEPGQRSSRSYGQSFSSVRKGPGSEPRVAPSPNAPLLPKGVTQPRRSSPRLQTFDYTGPYAYSITINADSGRPYFLGARFARLCIDKLHERATTSAFEVVAYCFMPNHAHLLVVGLTESSQLRPFMQQFKQVTGFAFKQEHGAPLWHRSYYDHVVRKDEDIQSRPAYIWANPVRAGLAQSAEDYPYSGPAEGLADRARRRGAERPLGGQSSSFLRTSPGASADRA